MPRGDEEPKVTGQLIRSEREPVSNWPKPSKETRQWDAKNAEWFIAWFSEFSSTTLDVRLLKLRRSWNVQRWYWTRLERTTRPAKSERYEPSRNALPSVC